VSFSRQIPVASDAAQYSMLTGAQTLLELQLEDRRISKFKYIQEPSSGPSS
jgi:hypothetical protein